MRTFFLGLILLSGSVATLQAAPRDLISDVKPEEIIRPEHRRLYYHVVELADQFADSLQRQEALLAGRSANQMIDVYVADQMNTLSHSICQVSQSFCQALDQVGDFGSEELKQLEKKYPKSKQWEKWRSTAVFSTVGALMFLFFAHDSYGFTAAREFLGVSDTVFSGGVFTAFSAGVFGYVGMDERRDRANVAKGVQQETNTVRAALQKVFFTRLREHGLDIPVQRGVQERWLLSKLEGGAIPEWERMTAREKKKVADDYARFFENIAAISPNLPPEVIAEIRAAAKNIDASSAGWTWWRSSKLRHLTVALSEGIRKVAELDLEHHFLSEAERIQDVHLQNRMVIEHPQLFTAEATGFFRQSRAPLPMEFQALAPLLSDLGAQLSFSVEVPPPHSAKKYLYRFGLSFGESTQLEPITFTVELNNADPGVAKPSEASAFLLAQRERLQFEWKFAEKFAVAENMARLQAEHERLFPKENCQRALSTTAPQFFEAVAEAF